MLHVITAGLCLNSPSRALITMPSSLTVGERIVLYLVRYQKMIDSFDVPIDVSQDGIAGSLGISRAHAAIELKKLKDAGEVVERLAHIKRGKTKRKVYFLSKEGEVKAARIEGFAKQEGIEIGPMIDIRRSRGQDLYASLSDDLKPILAGAAVFRKPFKRGALPDASAMILPVDREGMVGIPPEVRQSILKMLAPDELRRHHSRAADYWLSMGDYRERLFHLLESGRRKEAEMLVTSKGMLLLNHVDQDLLDLVSRLESPSEKGAARVRRVQGEVALLTHDLTYCQAICEEMKASLDRQERFEGLLLEGRLHRQRGELNQAMLSFDAAATISEGAKVPANEIERADTWLALGDPQSAMKTLEGLTRSGGLNDPEMIERAYLLFGQCYLNVRNGNEALKYISKSMAMTKSEDRRKWFKAMADAYSMCGMAEKAKEYAAKADPPKKWGEV